MPVLVETRLGKIHLEHNPEGWFYSIITFDHYSLSGNTDPLKTMEDAIEDAKITLEDYELNPDQYRD